MEAFKKELKFKEAIRKSSTRFHDCRIKAHFQRVMSSLHQNVVDQTLNKLNYDRSRKLRSASL